MIQLPQFFRVDDGCWCALARLVAAPAPSFISKSANAHSEHHSANPSLTIQRLAVRALCKALLTHLNIDDDIDEHAFPYRLKQAGHYLCFSHSKNDVAVILHSQRPCGIDIESREISWRLAQRFYHYDEIAQLQAIPSPQRTLVCRYLWQIKECVVKIEQAMLIPTLGQSFAQIIPELHCVAKNDGLQKNHTLTPNPEQAIIELSNPLYLNDECYIVGLTLASKLVIVF